MYYVLPILIAKIYLSSESKFVGLKASKPIAIEDNKFVIDDTPFNLAYVKRFFYKKDILFVKSDTSDISDEEVKTLFQKVKDTGSVFKDLTTLYTTDINDSYKSLGEMYHNLFIKIKNDLELRNIWLCRVDKYNFSEESTYINHNIERLITLKGFNVGFPYHIRFNKHPKANAYGDYGEGVVLMCISSSPYSVSFVKCSRSFLGGKIVTEEITLNIEEIINYDIDIIKMVSLNQLAIELDSVLADIDNLTKYYTVNKPTLLNTDNIN